MRELEFFIIFNIFQKFQFMKNIENVISPT